MRCWVASPGYYEDMSRNFRRELISCSIPKAGVVRPPFPRFNHARIGSLSWVCANEFGRHHPDFDKIWRR